MLQEKLRLASYVFRRWAEKALDEFPHYHRGTYPPERPLMISVHIPKTAGTSFRTTLRKLFGRTLNYDYGNTNPVTSRAIRSLLYGEMSQKQAAMVFAEQYARNIRCIHGHFDASKYWQIFPDACYVAWVRDPVDRVYSQYCSHKRAYDPYNEIGAMVYKGKLSFLDYARKEQNINLQTKLICGIPLEKYSFIGITERYDTSLNSFLQKHGFQHSKETGLLKNAGKGNIPMAKETRELVASLNAEDAALYEYACSVMLRDNQN